MSERNRDIDILRFFAIVGIFIAHSHPPGIIFQLRNFDVILMVLLLGASFQISNNNRKIDYRNYIVKRFKRLILPTWKFLSIFFLVFYLLSLLLNDNYYFSMKEIIMSYTLIDGIGYVWIMNVFLLVSLLNPFILYMSKKVKDNKKYFGGLLILYVVYLVLVIVHSTFSEVGKVLFDTFVLKGYSYALISAIGVRISNLTKKQIRLATVFFLGVFLIYMLINNFNSTQLFKYPPTTYYLSYGLFASFFIYLCLGISKFRTFFSNNIVYFVSENSLWLYFWHIIPIFLLKIYPETFFIMNVNFIMRFLFISVISITITYIQYKLSNKRGIKNINVEKLL